MRLLLFHASPDRKELYRKALSDFRADVVLCDESMENVPLALLAGRSAAALRGPAEEEFPPVSSIEEELLIIDQADRDHLGRALKAIRTKVPGSALKAMLTPTNAHWNARQLYTQLVMERALL